MGMSRKNVIEIIIFLYILLFLYAAISKYLDHARFLLQLGRSPILGPYANILVWFVPSVEIVITILLLFTKTRLIALLSSFTLMILFTIYIILILYFSNFIPCSCGGVLERMGWTEHLVFNFIFIVLAFIGIIFQYQENKISTNHEQTLTVP